MKRLALAVAALTASALAVPTAASTAASTAAPGSSTASAARVAQVTVTNGCLESVPEPGSTAAVPICYSIFKPAGASRRQRVPMLMHSHGWGGSRATSPGSVQAYLDAGYGVLSFDQRGFGASGGQAHVENPQFEGHDVRRLVALISRLPWVRQDAKGDPRLGAVGGSYGGGYQFLGAFELLRVKGKPVFDALAPEITWYDLHESLAPSDVVRTEWALALSAAAVPSNALPQHIYKALVEGTATGTWPDGSTPGGEDLNAFFEKNGPKWHVRHGRRLGIPVLLGQGTTDGLFPLQQGLANWQRALTAKARAQSIFVGYNGGHVLPAVFPRGVNVTSDPCSAQLAGGDFRQLAIKFFDEKLKGKARRLTGYGKLHLGTAEGGCVTVRSAAANATFEVGTVPSPQLAGPPVAVEVAQGPITVAGTPYLTANLTTLGLDSRAFYGLAIGTSPLDARLVQNNVLPLRQATPVAGEPRRVALPSVSVQVPEGQSLYVLASAVSDTFVGMGSRTPGVVLLEDVVAHLPVVRR